MTPEELTEAILKSLTPREEVIMRLSYGRYNFCEDSPYKAEQGKRYEVEEIARMMKLPRSRVEQIKAKACRKIAHRVLLKGALEYGLLKV